MNLRALIITGILVFICFSFGENAKAQLPTGYIYGITSAGSIPNGSTPTVFGQHITLINDYETAYYYGASADAFIFDTGYNFEHPEQSPGKQWYYYNYNDAYMLAYVDSSASVTKKPPQNTITVATLHRLFTRWVYIINNQYQYYDYFGYGFQGGGGYGGGYFQPTYNTIFVLNVFITLGTTSVILDPDQGTFTGVTPSGAAGGTNNQNVSLFGNGFNSGSTVQISGSGVSYSITSRTSTQIDLNLSVDSNAPRGDRSVTVTTNGFTSPSKNFKVGDKTPEITSVTPPSGQEGTSVPVVISGSGFGVNPEVKLNPAGILVSIIGQTTDTTINAIFTIPNGIGSKIFDVTVTSKGLGGNGFVSVPPGTQPQTPPSANAKFSSIATQIKGQIEEVGFADDLKLINMDKTIPIDPNDNLPTWSRKGKKYLAGYVKGTVPKIFAKLTMNVPSGLSNIDIRAQILGSNNTTQDVATWNNVSASQTINLPKIDVGSALQSTEMRLKKFKLLWSISPAGQNQWVQAGESGEHKIVWTYAQPIAPVFRNQSGITFPEVYDTVIEFAGLALVESNSPTARGEIIAAISRQIGKHFEYDPGSDSHPTKNPAIYLKNYQGLVCQDNALLLSGILRSVGIDSKVVYYWGGDQLTKKPRFFNGKRGGDSIPVFGNSKYTIGVKRPENKAPGGGVIPGGVIPENPYFSHHAVVYSDYETGNPIGGKYFDPSYGDKAPEFSVFSTITITRAMGPNGQCLKDSDALTALIIADFLDLRDGTTFPYQCP